MRKKIIVLIIWIILAFLYCVNLADIGWSMGANTNSAIEQYGEVITENEKGWDMVSYRQYDNLSKEFKKDFSIVGVTTVIFIAVTVGCYHVAFGKNDGNNKIL